MSTDIPYNIDEESSSPDYIDQEYEGLDEYGSGYEIEDDCDDVEYDTMVDEKD
jgi:hypothetical protein